MKLNQTHKLRLKCHFDDIEITPREHAIEVSTENGDGGIFSLWIEEGSDAVDFAISLLMAASTMGRAQQDREDRKVGLSASVEELRARAGYSGARTAVEVMSDPRLLGSVLEHLHNTNLRSLAEQLKKAQAYSPDAVKTLAKLSSEDAPKVLELLHRAKVLDTNVVREVITARADADEFSVDQLMLIKKLFPSWEVWLDEKVHRLAVIAARKDTVRKANSSLQDAQLTGTEAEIAKATDALQAAQKSLREIQQHRDRNYSDRDGRERVLRSLGYTWPQAHSMLDAFEAASTETTEESK